MVQKYLAKGYNKLGIQANSNIKIKLDNKQAIKKPSLQTHDGKSKRADLKAIKMKKSRSVKKSNVGVSLQSPSKSCEAPHQQGNPSVIMTPTKTPSPKKPSPYKSLLTSPHYMKSTSSSEARKENICKVSSIESTTSKLHKVAKTSKLKNMRTLTKVPSFKHTRSTTCKKVVLCQSSNVDMQRATCSSTLKDSKFPNYLKLKPGATEAEGKSMYKVCPYTYCSLNGHHHVSAPPLKRFLSSRRRIMKRLKLRTEVLSPRKAKPSKCLATEGKTDQNEDFFVEVFVSGGEIDTHVSQSFSDGPCSEIDLQDTIDHYDQNETKLLSMIFGPEDEGCISTPVQKKLSFESDEEINSNSNASLYDYFGENSDMDWEEGHSPDAYDVCEIYFQTDYRKDNQGKPGFELKSATKNLEFPTEEYLQQFHDEIVESLNFSDIDPSSDSETTQTGEKLVEELVMVTEHILSEENEITDQNYLPNGATQSLDDKSTDKHFTTFSDPLEEITKAQDEVLDSNENLVEITGEDADKGNSAAGEIKEADSAEFNTEQTEPSDSLATSSGSRDENASNSITNCGNIFSEKDADDCVSNRSTYSEEEFESNKIELNCDENNFLEMKLSAIQDHQMTEEAEEPSTRRNKMQFFNVISDNGESDSKLKTFEIGNKLKRSMRTKKAYEEIKEEREFNPRGPNFLPIEPEPEAEKVDLRHQDIDERKNTDEWMLDYALQKTVNQLAPARKRKVALLVEAFESVLPIPSCENRMRRNSSGFAHTRPIQACS